MNKLLFNGHEIVVKTEKTNIMGKYSELWFQEKVTKKIGSRNLYWGWGQTRTIMGRKEIFPQTRIFVILCIESWDGVCILS